MGTRRPTVAAVVCLLAFLFLWSTVVDAAACDNCQSKRCALNCGFLPGKRSEVSNRDDLNKLQQSKPPLGIQWTSSQQCTLDDWFEELPLDWQRHILGIFQLASTYTDPL